MSLAESRVEDAGCWSALGGAERRFAGRAALFLDRDGVVVEDTGYLSRVGDVALVPAAAAAIAAFNRAGVPVVLVTNQSGIARGYFDWAAFEAVQAEIARRLAARQAHLDAAFACGYHPAGQAAFAVADHRWRKPNPGMLYAAADRLGLDLSRSAIVGDRASDLEAGRSAGLAMGLHVATGQGSADQRQAALALTKPGFQVRAADDVAGALALLERLAGPSRC